MVKVEAGRMGTSLGCDSIV
jgi:hypothetical protein